MTSLPGIPWILFPLRIILLLSKQDQEVQDLCHEIHMVCISEVHEPEDDSMGCLNLDDYNSDDFDEYLSDNMET